MQTSSLLLLVRDGKTGSILVKPRDEHTWLVREKTGLGRAARNEWNIIKKVGTEFFEDMDKHREWHFGFKEVWQWTILLRVMEKLTVIALRSCRMGLGTWSALFDPVQQHSSGESILKPHLSAHSLAFV